MPHAGQTEEGPDLVRDFLFLFSSESPRKNAETRGLSTRLYIGESPILESTHLSRAKKCDICTRQQENRQKSCFFKQNHSIACIFGRFLHAMELLIVYICYMKKLTYGTYISLMVIILLSALTIFSSCSNKHEQIAMTLADADSLLNIDPEQSLELIRSLDTPGRLNKRDKAYRDYLYTSARYKAFYPVAEDSTIFSATDYFHRRGPQELYGKSLMMQGAVLYEQGKVEEALETYKEAEPILEEVGTDEDLGLLNTRIGELYQTSLVNADAARERYNKAIQCFVLSDNKHRIASSYVNYAKIILQDSLNKAKNLCEEALSFFKSEKDTISMLSSYEILNLVNYIIGRPFDLTNEIQSILNDYSNTIVADNYKNSFYYLLSSSYINNRDYHSANEALRNISITSTVDSIPYYDILINLCTLQQNWEQAYEYQQRYSHISDSILFGQNSLQLAEIERKYDMAHKEEEFLHIKIRNLSIIFILAIALILTLSITFIIRKQLKEREKENLTYLANVESLREQLAYDESIISEMKDKPITDNNKELQKILGELLSIINDIGYTYSINESNPKAMAEKVQNKIDDYLSKNNLFEVLPKFIDNRYPGMLEKIISINSKLTDEDKWIIYLMCSDFSTNAICIMTKLDESQLNYRKTILAKKLNTKMRISKFLKELMIEYKYDQIQ